MKLLQCIKGRTKTREQDVERSEQNKNEKGNCGLKGSKGKVWEWVEEGQAFCVRRRLEM